jgi:hypothetical protein
MNKISAITGIHKPPNSIKDCQQRIFGPITLAIAYTWLKSGVSTTTNFSFGKTQILGVKRIHRYRWSGNQRQAWGQRNPSIFMK